MKTSVKARILLGIFMMSGILGQATTFYASDNGEDRLPSDTGRLASSDFSESEDDRDDDGEESKSDEDDDLPDFSNPNCYFSIGGVSREVAIARYREWRQKCKDDALGVPGLRLEFDDSEFEWDGSAAEGNFYNPPSYSLSAADRAKGNTMLHVAASRGDVETFKYYDTERQNNSYAYYYALYVKNKDGNTPLHVAVENGQFEVIKWILSYMVGNNINPGETISGISRDLSDRNEYPYGIDGNLEHFLQIRNHAGETVLDLARSSLSYNVVRTMEQASFSGNTDIAENVCGMCRYNRILDLLDSCLRISQITGRYSGPNSGTPVTEEDEDALVSAVSKDTAGLYIGGRILADWAKAHGCSKLSARLMAPDVIRVWLYWR